MGSGIDKMISLMGKIQLWESSGREKRGNLEMRKNELYYKLIDQILSDGQVKEFCDIAQEMNSKMEEGQYDVKKLRDVICLMKNKGELKRTEDGKYYKSEIIKEEEKKKKASKYDFSSFLQVKPSGRKETEEVLGVWKNGELTVNAKLLKHFPEHRMNIRISPDCSEIVLFLEGEEMVNVGKNGRTKNYDLQKKLKEQKKNLPAYYVGEWDEEEELWYGKYLPYNPNKGEKQLKK